MTDPILARLTALEARVAALEAARAAPAPSPAAVQSAPAGGGVAPARDLDGKYGNPIVRKDPPRWGGESCKGRPFSECPADYLDELAGFLDWRAEREAEQPEKAKYARFSRADAARARGWAARARMAPVPQQSVTDDEIPF